MEYDIENENLKKSVPTCDCPDLNNDVFVDYTYSTDNEKMDMESMDSNNMDINSGLSKEKSESNKVCKKIYKIKNISIYLKNHKYQLVIALLFFLLISCTCTIFAIFYVANKPHFVSTMDELLVKNSDELEMFEFQLNGVNYQVPIEFSYFANNGWSLLEEGVILTPGESKPLAMSLDDYIIYLNIKNPTNNPLNAEECVVVQISVFDTGNETTNPLFITNDGITLKASYEKMKDVFGVYDVAEKIGEEYIYTYYYGQTAAVKFTINANLGITSIILNRSDLLSQTV